MTVMNITGCRMFEDEIVDTLCKDPKIDDIIIIENQESAGLTEKLEKCGISYRMISPDEISNLYSSANNNEYVVTVNIMPLSLHGDPKHLRDQVYGSIKRIADFSDGIFLFYGLCGNVLRRIEKDLDQLPCPVSILKDNEGKIVDDCIGAAIGGRKSFLKIVSGFNRKSAIVMTPMWVKNWQEMFQHSGFIENREDIEMARFVLDSMGYETVVKIDTGLQYTDGYHEMIEEFADTFQLNILEIKGKHEIINGSYAVFRDKVMESQTITGSGDVFAEIGNEIESPMVKTA
ncbi:DUF1638 domain-containing protein [Methanolobus zinderi]|uniref:DUF1638 domain-containing protein n=1 Tax=Methanolobus zinderi TaxID=536044 RepID=A0A7D5E6T2_9EURY|nr:DUF1638 domain-containing protein [Methanolobus zinderi]QLC50113.1 DUF1638 domain-containing protein [Methanolobus zinderi]